MHRVTVGKCDLRYHLRTSREKWHFTCRRGVAGLMVESGQTDDGNVSNIATETFCIVPSYLRCLDLLDLSGVVPTIGEKYFALTFPVTTLPPLPPCKWSVVLLSPGLQESLSPVSWTAGLSLSPCKCDSPPPYTFLSPWQTSYQRRKFYNSRRRHHLTWSLHFRLSFSKVSI